MFIDFYVLSLHFKNSLHEWYLKEIRPQKFNIHEKLKTYFRPNSEHCFLPKCEHYFLPKSEHYLVND